MKKKLFGLLFVLFVAFSLGADTLYASEVSAETSNETKIPEISNTFNTCKGSAVDLSITCIGSDEFSFECLDKCGLFSKCSGYSSIISPFGISYEKTYSLIFNTSGEHIVSVYKNGILWEGIKVIVAKSHSYDSGIIAKEATCTKDGEKKYTCNNCKNVYIEKIPATGHNYVEKVIREAKCESDGRKEYTCSYCGDSYKENIPALGHSYSEWKVIKPATIFKNGKMRSKCLNCNDTKTKTIKKQKAFVKISKNKLNLKEGKSYKLKIKKMSSGDSVKEWSSSNIKIVSIDKETGEMKTIKKGKTTITLTMKSGCKAKCKVTVK